MSYKKENGLNKTQQFYMKNYSVFKVRFIEFWTIWDDMIAKC